jgi:hypothetical protein
MTRNLKDGLQRSSRVVSQAYCPPRITSKDSLMIQELCGTPA